MIYGVSTYKFEPIYLDGSLGRMFFKRLPSNVSAMRIAKERVMKMNGCVRVTREGNDPKNDKVVFVAYPFGDGAIYEKPRK